MITPLNSIRRVSLVTQATDLLRKNLVAGRWPDHLPGQRDLSRQMQVSGRTLRAALKLLAREGRIKIEHGRATRVMHRARARSVLRVVRLLISQPMHELTQINLYRFSELRRCLAATDFALEVHVDPASQRRYSLRGLDALIRENPASCWVLHVSKSEVQRWFAERNLPTVVTKSSHPGVDLPSVDVDWHALGRHAAGRFLGLGHRRVALLLFQDHPADETAIKEGFLAGFRDSPHPDAKVVVALHGPTAKNVDTALKEMLAGSNRPTGLFVPGTGYAFAAMGCLSQMRLRIPEHLSIATQVADSSIIQYAIPSLAHYRVDWDLHARKLTRLVLRIAASGAPEPRHVRLLPEFQSGDSLATAPKS
ncbi:MAG: substrate-binding domain-containing protein [Verrucomicrobiae bacterium]|nr:substrate-binding domain-containing protein [Verrucomicrobiae bacterium]